MSTKKSSSIWEHFTIDLANFLYYLLLLLGLTSNFCTIQLWPDSKIYDPTHP